MGIWLNVSVYGLSLKKNDFASGSENLLIANLLGRLARNFYNGSLG